MRKKLTLLIFSFAIWIGSWFAPISSPAGCRFIALDVGQGDAIYIRTPDGQDILVDGGIDGRAANKLHRLLPAGDTDIEVVLSTHPDGDHLKGLIDIVEQFPVRTLLTTGVATSTQLSKRWQQTLQEIGLSQTIVMAGQKYSVGSMAQIAILWPEKSYQGVTDDTVAVDGRGGINDTSIVAKLTCAGSAALLTGDASDAVEEKLILNNADLTANILKISHHGSRFATSVDFLRTVKPTWGVISVGKENGYKHPHGSVLLRLNQADVTALRTDELGDIELRSDGNGGWKRQP